MVHDCRTAAETRVFRIRNDNFVFHRSETGHFSLPVGSSSEMPTTRDLRTAISKQRRLSVEIDRGSVSRE